jgi:hypothetical protein
MRLGSGCLLLAAMLAFGQGGNGTITGTVSDPAGAVIANASVEAKNTETGVLYTAASTSTGNYTLSNLPVGNYQLNVKVTGFKSFAHTNLQLGVAAVLKEDVTLQVGAASDSVTVNAEATLLATESSALSTNVTLQQLDNLPILGIGTNNAGSSGVRNPYSLMLLIPGIDYIANNAMIINGLGGVNAPTEGFRIEGQDFTNHILTTNSAGNAVQQNQPSADAIQEVAVQTSNYAAEFGTAGAGVINITMKSGTNQYHGSMYDYFVNEDLNAGYAFSVSTIGSGKYRPRNRRNDFGGTMGGPIYIPKIYDGHNKTFFFWNYEEYVESQQYAFPLSLPAASYLTGDFSAISPNGTCSLCSQYGIQQTALGIPTPTSDALGRPMLANTIYDPLTRATNPSNNLGYATPFPNNVIPTNRLDPVALAIQNLFPKAQNANLSGNATGSIQGQRYTTIPSIKIDEVLTGKDKLSFYYSKTSTESLIASPNGNADGLPVEIGQYRGTLIYASTYRLNYDRSLTPTLLLHLGGGYWRENFGDKAPFTSFNPSAFGLNGFLIHRQFPSVLGMCVIPAGQTQCTGAGGMQNIGTVSQLQTLYQQEKPTFNANVTKVHQNHTFKAGAELYYQGYVLENFAGVTLTTGVGPTSQPFTPTVSLNNFTQGFGYASFLLGDYTSTAQSPQVNYRLGKYQFATFVQDSWKVNRKLTLDYGIRWDLASQGKETYGRLGEFDPTAPNANAGGHPGATRFASTCNCDFYPHAYPYAIGPRIGVAYQIDPKTVFRGGWGVVYQYATDGAGGGIVSSPGTNAPAGINAFVNTQQPGFIAQPTWPITNPNNYPNIGTTAPAPTYPDRNYTRPPRINQWSVGFQREINRNLVLEAAYVANRAIWLADTATAGPGNTLNQLSAAQYAQYGLYPFPGTGPVGTNNYADFQLLSQAISSTTVKQKLALAGVPNGGLLLPYPGFPTSTSLKSTLYPFPQFGALANTNIANNGSRYDALQIKGTKRLSHGLQVSGTFSWSRAFLLSNRQDFFNPQSAVWELQPTDQPFLFNMNAVYTTPKAPFLDKLKFANTVVKDWQIGAFTQYGSGALLAPPTSPTSNLLGSEFSRVAGQPLYNVSMNSHNINPYYDQVLNPNAWAVVPTNGVGPALGTYYTDFRGPRRPQENFNIGRNFRIKERMNLQFRGEFSNIFNRLYMPTPSTISPLTPLTRNSFGYYTAGFGTMAAYSAPGGSLFDGLPASIVSAGHNPASRSGTLILRFTF